MPTTRSAASKESSNSDSKVGEKRSAESPSGAAPKRTKSTKGGGKKQKTIDETINGDAGGEDVKQVTNGKTEEKDEEKEQDLETRKEGKDDESSKTKDQDAAINQEKSKSAETKSGHETSNKVSNKESHEDSKAQDKTQANQDKSTSVPSTVHEKGLIYFFFKPRVNNDSPQSINDVARSYIILRPLPLNSPLNDDTLQKASTVRMLALPKKTLPKSKRDRFLAFVEKGQAKIEEVRDSLTGGDYETKTKGTSHQPSSRPFASGIYALTSQGRTSHLAYHLSTPVDEIQSSLGLASKGSFVVSVKNPEAPAPPSANVTYMKPASYEGELQERFEGRRWGKVESEYLDVLGTQILLIGEGRGEFGKAVEDTDGKGGAEEMIEELEDEEQDRVEGLTEDDPIFVDLGLNFKEFETLQTTW